VLGGGGILLVLGLPHHAAAGVAWKVVLACRNLACCRWQSRFSFLHLAQCDAAGVLLLCFVYLQAFRSLMFRVDQELKWMHFDELRARYIDSLEAQQTGEAVEEALTVAAWVREHLSDGLAR
jgi:hypothetical protein